MPEGCYKYFAEWSERDVTDFVHRDRNHPSIVLLRAGSQIGEQSTPDGPHILRRLKTSFIARTRPVRSPPAMSGGVDPHWAVGAVGHIEVDGALDYRVLWTAQAQSLRGDTAAARLYFDSVVVLLNVEERARPDERGPHALRGFALAALGRRAEVLREAGWLDGDGIHASSDMAQLGETGKAPR